MSKKVVNIDDLLAENQLELTIKGKVYTVKDFDLENFLRVMQDPSNEDPTKQKEVLQEHLAMAFEVEASELKDIGLRALFLIVTEIRDWIVGDAEEVAGVDTENP